jgi:hypothetical protein
MTLRWRSASMLIEVVSCRTRENELAPCHLAAIRKATFQTVHIKRWKEEGKNEI